MDDKHIDQYIRRQYNINSENYVDRKYYGPDKQLQYDLRKSLGLKQYYSTKMPMDGEINFPQFNNESRFDNSVRKKYPSTRSLINKKDTFFISRNDEF